MVKLLIAGLGTTGVFVALSGCSAEIGNPKGNGSTVSSSGGTGPTTGSGSGSGSGGGPNTGSSGSGGIVQGGPTPTGGTGNGVLNAPFARLTRAEYQATIKAAFGVTASIAGIPDDARVGPFTSNIAVMPDQPGPYMLASEDLAALIVPSQIPACTAATASTCIPQNYQAPIEKLYRRPLTAAELTAFSTMLKTLETAGVSSQDATRTMVSTALMSPDFLFRATPIAGATARAQQLAEQLSYALWDAPPDTALSSAAQGSATDLGTRLRTQAERLGKDPRAVVPLARFMAQWLRVDVDVNLADPTYATSPLYVELLAFVQDALTNNVPVTSFVNGTHGFVQKDSFAKYAMPAVSSTANVVPVTWPATSARRGVIGEELVIDATRHPDPTRRPIFRGHLVQSSLLCTTIQPPSPDLQALAGAVADRTTDARCMNCHLLMDPVGKAFASLDLDHTGPTPAVTLTGNTEVAGTYADLPTLLDKIAKSQSYADCFSRYLLGFFLEQDPTLLPTDPKVINADAVADVASIVKSGGGFADAVAQMVVSLEARSKSVTPWCTGP